MPHDPVRLADTKAWMTRAASDLGAGAHELTAVPPFTAAALFHAQQAAEKALKGFLAWHDVPVGKTDDLASLGRLCAEIDPSLAPLGRRAARLTEYAWKYRYPGEPEDRRAKTPNRRSRSPAKSTKPSRACRPRRCRQDEWLNPMTTDKTRRETVQSCPIKRRC
jgi:HEPN domain-containing protein